MFEDVLRTRLEVVDNSINKYRKNIAMMNEYTKNNIKAGKWMAALFGTRRISELTASKNLMMGERDIIKEQIAGHKRTLNLMRAIQKVQLSVGLAFLFTGMALRNFFLGALRGMFDTYTQIINVNNEFFQKTQQVRAGWEFLKFSIIDALSQSPLFMAIIGAIINVINWVGQWDQKWKILAGFMIISGMIIGGLLFFIGSALLFMLFATSLLELAIMLWGTSALKAGLKAALGFVIAQAPILLFLFLIGLLVFAIVAFKDKFIRNMILLKDQVKLIFLTIATSILMNFRTILNGIIAGINMLGSKLGFTIKNTDPLLDLLSKLDVERGVLESDVNRRAAEIQAETPGDIWRSGKENVGNAIKGLLTDIKGQLSNVIVVPSTHT